MDIALTLQPTGNTTERELAELTARLRQAVARVPAVSAIEDVKAAAPDGAKGLLAVIGKLLITLAPDAVTGVFDVLKNLANRPNSPPFSIKIGHDGSVEAVYDPRTGTLEQFKGFVAAAQAKPAG